VLIMGFSAQMINWPDDFCNGIADAGYRVVRFDNRDIGLSHQFDDKGVPDMGAIMQKVVAGEDANEVAPYLLDDMSDDTAAIIDALELGTSHLIGASMGGMVAQIAALKYPEMVRSLIPVMTTSGAPELPPSQPEAIAALTSQPASPARDDVLTNGLQKQRAIGSHPDVRDSDEDLLARIGQSYDRAFRPMGVARQYGAILAQPRWHEALSNISVPTMVIHGKEDPLIPIACGEDIAERIPGAKMVGIDKWGHDLSTSILPTLTKHVVDFLLSTKV